MSAIEVLKQPKLSLSDLLSALAELDAVYSEGKTSSIGISANITTDLFAPAFKKQSYLCGVKSTVVMGDFDSHLENVKKFSTQKVEQLLIINVFDNLSPSFESQIELLDDVFLESIRSRVREELRLVLAEAKSFKQIFIGRFHCLRNKAVLNQDDRLRQVVLSFNQMLESAIDSLANVQLISLEDIVTRIGEKDSLNSRFYFQFKAPYTLPFWDELSRRILLATKGQGTYFYKALVLDCDNTIWGGIVGEDLLSGIQLNPFDYPGNIFWFVQQEILKLERRGVLICLCSKNNQADVDEVLLSHPHQLIKDSHLILKKVNWEPKVENLRQIAAELNIGLESLVFLDDSPFECESVRAQLPMVKTIQIPKNIFEYPATIEKVSELFPISRAGESNKTEQYKLRQMAIEGAKEFATQEEYLASLQLKVELHLNPKPTIARISELSNKSNQFNLTTLRLSEGEVAERASQKNSYIYSIDVSDRFGKHGLTGVLVAKVEAHKFVIENFLMSCRVIGRGIEFAFWPQILADAKAANCETISASYVKSEKNSMVEDFYERLGLPVVSQSETAKHYFARITDLEITTQGHVEVDYV